MVMRRRPPAFMPTMPWLKPGITLPGSVIENDPASKRWRFGFVQFSQADFATARIDNFGSDFAAASVENNNLLAVLHAQNVARVVGFRVRQHERLRVPILRRNVKAVHGTGCDGTAATYGTHMAHATTSY